MRTATITLLILAALTASASAEQCAWGTNRPGSDVNPAQRINATDAQARCNMVVTQRTDSQGTVHTTKTWSFSVSSGK